MVGSWLIISGFVLLVAGSSLRTVMMMRGSDVTAPEGRVLHGRELLRQYRASFPRSRMPALTRSLLLGGLVLVLAGLASQFAH